MRRTLFLAVMMCVAAGAGAQSADRTEGPWVGVHITHASGSTIDDSIPGLALPFTTSSGSGGGLSVGFGVLPWLAAYTTLDAAGGQTVSMTAITMSGDLMLTQADVGLRAILPLRTLPLRPYASLAYGSRLMSGDVQATPYGAGTFANWGSAFSFGAGVEYFFAREFAIDVSYTQSVGTYRRVLMPNGATFDANASSTSNSRVAAGVTWHPGPSARPTATLATHHDSLTSGLEVRLLVGHVRLVGTVVQLGRDSLVLQRIVKDTAVQTPVPLDCVIAAEERIRPKPAGPFIGSGAALGAIGGSLVGVVMGSNSASEPSAAGAFGATYVLGGAVVGGLIGYAADRASARWQPLDVRARTSPAFQEKETLCRPWNP